MCYFSQKQNRTLIRARVSQGISTGNRLTDGDEFTAIFQPKTLLPTPEQTGIGERATTSANNS